jgi:hypothetical protein
MVTKTAGFVLKHDTFRNRYPPRIKRGAGFFRDQALSGVRTEPWRRSAANDLVEGVAFSRGNKDGTSGYFWSMIFSANRSPPLKCGAGFCGITL